MALKVGELFATLNLDDDGFKSGLAGAKNSAMSAMSDIVKTLGVSKLGKEAFSAFTDFESAFAGVKKTVDETANTSFADLEEALIGMSKELPATAVEIAAVAESAGQLGIGADNIEEFTRVMIDLGEATNLTADEAATTLARFANIMGTSGDEYSNLGSTIVDLGNNFATTESEIAEMAQRMASASKQIGMSEADVLGFAAAFSSVGIESDAGGSAFSTFVSNLSLAVSKGGSDLAEYAKVAGMSANEFKQAFGEDATGAIMAFIEGLGEAEDGIGILSELGITEVRQRNALLSAANASDMFASAIDTANSAYAENNALTEEASKRYATIESRIAMLKNQITELARQFGAVMVPAFEAFYPIASNAIEKITNLSDRTKQIIVGVAGVAAAIGPAKLIIAGFGKAVAAAGGLLTAMINPLTVAAGGFVLLYKNSKRVRDAVDKLKKSFKFLFDALEYGTEPLKAVYQSLRAGFGADIADQFLATTDKIKAAWGSMVSWIQDSAKYIGLAFNIGKSSDGVFGGLELSARAIWARLSALFKDGWTMLGQSASTLGPRIGAALEKALTSIRLNASEFIGSINWTGIWNGIAGTYDALKTKAGEILGKLPEIISGFIEDAANFTGSGQFAELGEKVIGFLAAGIKSKAGGGAAKIINALSGLFDGISLGDIDDSLQTALSNIGDVVVNAMTAGIAAAANGATSLINAVSGLLQSALTEENLSAATSALLGFGSTIIDILVQGIASVADGGAQIMSAVASMLAGINWENVGESIGGFASDLITNLATKLSEIDGSALATSLGDVLGKAAGGLLAACAGIVSTIVNNIITDGGWGTLGKALYELLLGALKFAWDSVKAFAASIGEVIVDLITPKLTVEGFSVDDSWVDSAMENFDAVNAANGITERVAKMINDGLSKDEVVAEIENLKTKFNLSENDIGTLEESGYWDSLQTAIDGYFQQNVITADVPVESTVSADENSTPDFSGLAQDIQDKYTTEQPTVPLTVTPEITAADTAQLTASATEQIGSAGTEAGSTFGSNVADAITASMSSVTSAVNDIVNAAKTAAANGAGSMTNSGLNFARGLAIGIRTGQTIVSAAARSVAQAAVDAANSTLQIHSPSKVTESIGGYFSKGFAKGITGSATLATSAANDLARSAANAATFSNPGARAQATYTAAAASRQEIDYDRLADAMNQRPMYMTQDGVVYAEIQERNNAVVRNSRSRSIALGYGR